MITLGTLGREARDHLQRTKNWLAFISHEKSESQARALRYQFVTTIRNLDRRLNETQAKRIHNAAAESLVVEGVLSRRYSLTLEEIDRFSRNALWDGLPTPKGEKNSWVADTLFPTEPIKIGDPGQIITINYPLKNEQRRFQLVKSLLSIDGLLAPGGLAKEMYAEYVNGTTSVWMVLRRHSDMILGQLKDKWSGGAPNCLEIDTILQYSVARYFRDREVADFPFAEPDRIARFLEVIEADLRGLTVVRGTFVTPEESLEELTAYLKTKSSYAGGWS